MRFAPYALLLVLVACGGEEAPLLVDAGVVDTGIVDAARDANLPRDLGPVCSEACGVGESCCNSTDGGVCIALLDDVMNCGACANSCLNGKGTECSSGQCVCGSILEGCGGSRRSMCCPAHDSFIEDYCANFDDDATDCGSCGHTCDPAMSDRCSGGHCFCGTEGDTCAGTPEDLCCVDEFEDGLCVDTRSNVRHCGACNHVCNGLLGERCVNSECTTGT